MTNRKQLRREDVAAYREQAGLKGRLEKVFRTLGKRPGRNSYCYPFFCGFVEALVAPPIRDGATLPFSNFSKGANSWHVPTLFPKEHCLLLSASFIICQWWGYLRKEVPATRINHYINYLEDIASNGLENFDVTGDVKRGYRLRKTIPRG